MARDHNRAYGAHMIPTFPSPALQPGPVRPTNHLRHAAFAAASTLSTLAALLALAACVLATRRVRTVPGYCDNPWHCTTMVVTYNPITITVAVGMLAVLVWQLRAVTRFWRARRRTPPPSSGDAWCRIIITGLVSVPAFVIGGLFCLAPG